MERITDIMGIYKQIKEVSLSHLKVAKFDAGESNDFSVENLYPLVYLELPWSIQEKPSTETYKIVLTVCERPNESREHNIEDIIKSQSACKQIAAEIRLKLSQTDGWKIGDGNYLSFTEQGDDVVSGVRLEFDLTTHRHVSKCDDVFKK